VFYVGGIPDGALYSNCFSVNKVLDWQLLFTGSLKKLPTTVGLHEDSLECAKPTAVMFTSNVIWRIMYFC